MNKNLAFAIMSAWKVHDVKRAARQESQDWDDMVEAVRYLQRYGLPSKPAKEPLPPTGMIGGGAAVLADEQPMASREAQRELARLAAARIADDDT